MNNLSRRLALSIIVLSAPVLGIGQAGHPQAAEEINEGARLYKSGKFAEAQQHFERALQLDPTHKNAPIFVARSIHAQFKPGEETPANFDVAREAIAAYRKVLEFYPDNEDAYNAVAYLYGAIKEEVEQAAWIEQRASRADVPAEKRAEAYTVLASKKWDCSYKITERRENRQTVTREGKAVLTFIMPKDMDEFALAQRCADEGLNLIEQAIGLNPESEAAWSYKTNLLREKAKHAEMQGQAQEKEMWTQQADEAQNKTTQLSGQQRNKNQR